VSEQVNERRAPGDWSVEGEPFVGFGAAELAYLLSRYEGPAVDRTAELLRVDRNAASEEFVAAGASSLLARGLLKLRGDQLDLVGPAAATAYALAGAEHWTELAFMIDRETAADGALVLRAGSVVTLLQPRALGTWFVLAKEPGVETAEAVVALADGFLAGHEGGAVFLAAHSAAGDATAFLRRSAESQWELARGEAVFWEPGIEVSGRDSAVSLVAQLLSASGVEL